MKYKNTVILNTTEYTIKKLAKYTIHTQTIKNFNRYTKIHTRIHDTRFSSTRVKL